MKEEGHGQVSRELDRILGIMEKRAMEKERKNGGAFPVDGSGEPEELILEELDEDWFRLEAGGEPEREASEEKTEEGKARQDGTEAVSEQAERDVPGETGETGTESLSEAGAAARELEDRLPDRGTDRGRGIGTTPENESGQKAAGVSQEPSRGGRSLRQSGASAGERSAGNRSRSRASAREKTAARELAIAREKTAARETAAEREKMAARKTAAACETTAEREAEAGQETQPSHGGAPVSRFGNGPAGPGTEPEKPRPVTAAGHSRRAKGFNGEKAAKEAGRGLLRPMDGLLAAFWVPVIIMLIIFIQRRIFPFGDNSFLRTDMYHQYAPFFSEFHDKLRNGGSLLYSWDVGGGVNFAALYAYYLASPVNWLIILCPKGFIIEFMTYMIVLKIGLSGLTFAWYLRKHCGTRDFGTAFFGIFYALSGYMAAYSWNIMWLDCIWLFPLVMLGAEQLVKEKKGLLYCVTLGLSILSNYYISIMTCIFMVIYFLCLLVLERRKRLKGMAAACLRFGVYSLLAGGMAAVVLLPEVYALQMTASGDVNFPKTFESYFSIIDMLARHIANVEVEVGLDHWPNIYCGVAVFLFFLLYLASRKISIKEKAVYCTLLMVFFASFSINVLNFIWHGFHYPNSLPCRQSFIYVFLMLVICYRAYMYLEETPWKHVVIAFWGSVCFVLLAEQTVTDDAFHFIVFYVAVLFLALYAGLIYLRQKGTVNGGVLVLLALAVVSVEAAVNTTATSVTTTSRTAYVKDNEDVRDLVAGLTPADTFYRIEKVDGKTKNDGAWMNFPTVSLFSSTANADMTDLFKKLGCEASTNAYSIEGSTPLVDSLFSIRYGLYSWNQGANPLLTLAGQEGDTWLYRKEYTLPLGFGISMDLEDNWQLDLGNPADVQNDLCTVLGTPWVLEEVYGEDGGGTYAYTVEAEADYYAYITNRQAKKVKVAWGEESTTYDNVNRGYLLELGRCQPGEEIVLTCEDPSGTDLKARIYRFNDEALSAVYNILAQNEWVLTEWTDTTLKGSIHMDQPGLLYTSIPYDKGWTVLVDGEETETRKLFDTFLTVELPEGSHTVEMSYEPQGLRLGALITAGCVLIVAACAVSGRAVRGKKEKKKWNS